MARRRASACSCGRVGGCVGGRSATRRHDGTPADAAATVNGVPIAKADFDADLKDYAANSLYTATGVAGDVSQRHRE